MEPKDDGTYEHQYDYPTIFRLDRIVDIQPTGEKFRVKYAERFEEGEFRKRIQFMYAGDLMKITFRYTGSNVKAVLDRLPIAEIIQEHNGQYIIQAEVFGKGIVMWLLSQGKNVEVLTPASLREEMKETLVEMKKMYE